MMQTSADEFRQAIEQAGLHPPSVIYDDGKLHRFASNGDKDDDAGWYTLFTDGLPAGAFGCWRTGLKETWCSKSDRQMTAQERADHRSRLEAIHREREQEQRRRQEHAAQRAMDIWSTLEPASSHPYLSKKQVSAYGLRQSDDGALVIPMFDEASRLSSLQFIQADGTKRFLPGGRVQGCFHLLGEIARIICLAEGYATAASIHEATGLPVAVAFNAGNLLPVALLLRKRHTQASLIVCGDSDTSEVGQTKAREAAQAVDGLVVLPEDEGTDWNDVHSQDGLDAVKVAIFAAVEERGTMTNGSPMNSTISPALSKALVNYTDLMALHIAERPRHLPWLPEGGNVMVFGPRGIGKTFLQLALAVSLTTGNDLLKWKVPSPVGVLYLDGEMQLDELRDRATALMDCPPVAPLEFLTSQLVYQRCGGKDLVLTSEAMRQEVVTILDDRPDIRVLILDNISCLFSGINEDSKQDWEPINAWLIRLRHRGLATVLVHHAGKGGQQRGTSGREDSLDTVIQLKEPAGADAREGCHFEMYFTKCRSVTGEDVAPLDVRLQQVGSRFQWQYQAVEISKFDEARRLFAEGVTTPTELSEELGINKGYASRILKKLRAENA
jgi:putative DNA primase/helicase